MHEREHVKVNPNPPKLKFEKDRVHIFQENVQLNEKLEPLKTLINKPEIDKLGQGNTGRNRSD